MGVRHASHHVPFPLFTTKILSVGQNTAAARCSDAAYVWGVDYGIIPDTDDGYAFAPPEKDGVMSLHPQPITPVPEQTARVAAAAFPKGNPYLLLREHLGTIFQDEDFAALFPAWGTRGSPRGAWLLSRSC